MEVLTATIDLDDIRTYRGSLVSLADQASVSDAFPRIRTPVDLCLRHGEARSHACVRVCVCVCLCGRLGFPSPLHRAMAVFSPRPSPTSFQANGSNSGAAAFARGGNCARPRVLAMGLPAALWTRTCMRVCVCARAHVCACFCMRVCACVCMCVHVCVRL